MLLGDLAEGVSALDRVGRGRTRCSRFARGVGLDRGRRSLGVGGAGGRDLNRLTRLQLAQIHIRVGILERLEGDPVGLGDVVSDVAALDLVFRAGTGGFIGSRVTGGRSHRRGDAQVRRSDRRVGHAGQWREGHCAARRVGHGVGIRSKGQGRGVGVAGSGLNRQIDLIGGGGRLRIGGGTLLVATIEQDHQEHRHVGAENEGSDAEGGFALGGLFQFGARQQRGVGDAHGIRQVDGAS